MTDLVYCVATILEIQRISAVGPGSLPHVLTKPTNVNGYDFPEGSIFMANLTKYMNDPDVFENPDTFLPERFIDIENSGKPKLKVSRGDGGLIFNLYKIYNYIFLILYSLNFSKQLSLSNRKSHRLYHLELGNVLAWESL